MIMHYRMNKQNPIIACIGLSTNKCDIALVQRKKNMFYIHDFQSHIFNTDILCNGHIFNMTLLGQQLQKILQECHVISPYIALSVAGELVQERLEGFKNNTLYSTQLPANQNKYYIGIARSQLLQYQLLSFKLNKSCITLTSYISCLLQLAYYAGFEIQQCDTPQLLESFLIQVLRPITPQIISLSSSITDTIKMMGAGLYLLSVPSIK